MSERKVVWDKLARFWKLEQLMKMHAEISLEELNHKIDLILKGQLKEKTIVNIFP
ncbi:MAG: hypothetical protein SVU94_07635 [Bacteroidota bacterium]|nr:hypothetical protein [Bacteroidota bacterium]